jgi:hypothetical protein
MPASHPRSIARRRLLALAIGGLALAGCRAEAAAPTPDRYATVQTSINATNTALSATATPTPATPRQARTPIAAAPPTAPRPTPAPATIAAAQGPGPAPSTAGADLRPQIAIAEAALVTGSFEYLADYGHGVSAATSLQFDLGADSRPPRLHLVTTYTATTGTRTAEYVTVGDQTWQRTPEGGWRRAAAQPRPIEQVQALLPRVESVPALAPANPDDPALLTGYDRRTDADLVLEVDPVTGTPIQLRRIARATGLIVTVTYQGWNTPVRIDAPGG